MGGIWGYNDIFFTKLSRRCKKINGWTFWMPTIAKVGDLSTTHRLQTQNFLKRTSKESWSLTLSLPTPLLLRFWLRTFISFDVIGIRPWNLHQWIPHWNLHPNTKSKILVGPILSRDWHFPRKRRRHRLQEGRPYSWPNFSVLVWSFLEHKWYPVAYWYMHAHPDS